MDEETLNMSTRKFLKKVGVTSQRDIEKAVKQAISDGTLSGSEKLSAKMTLHLPELNETVEIDGEIELE